MAEFLSECFNAVVKPISNFFAELVTNLIELIINVVNIPIKKCRNKPLRVVLRILSYPVSIAMALAIPILIIIGIVFVVDTANERNIGIESISFNNSEEIHFDLSEKPPLFGFGFNKNDKTEYFIVEFKGNKKQQEKARNRFKPEDVEFVFSDDSIAAVTFETDPGIIDRILEKIPLKSTEMKIGYKITALTEGETVVYIQSVDGKVKSQEFKIIVTS